LISEPLKERISQLEGIVADYEAFINDEGYKKTCEECEERARAMESLKSEYVDSEAHP
jgi:hypothetical protein